MIQRTLTSIFPALVLVVLAAGELAADGFIYVDGSRVRPPRPHPGPVTWTVPRPDFPLQVVKHRVEIRIDGTVARTRVDETFYNPNPAQLEGTYMFPLPPGASISNFAMSIGGKKVEGEVLEREKAREIYESIVRKSRDPGLLEFVERGLFRARVFPIPAMGNVEVEVEYEESLPLTAGFGRYRYPLNTGKYSAGDYREVLIDLKLTAGAPLRSVNCPSHTVSVTRSGEREARVVFEAKTLKADKDFVLDWYVSEDALAPALLTHRTHERSGFFFLTISPRPRQSTPAPKDLIAVIDTSGSMAGRKIQEARHALRHFVNSLNRVDRFNIIDFSTEARRFREGLVAADEETRKQALAYIDGLEARGGTNIEEGLRFALDDLAGADEEKHLKLVTLITDGEPTVGITGTGDIVRAIEARNTQGRRIYCFGVGVDLNAQLLEQLVRKNHGALEYVLPGENMEVKLSTFWDKIDFPVLTNLRLEFPGLDVNEIYPRPLPDLFRGEQLQVLGRFGRSGYHPVVLRGKFQGEERVFEYSLDFGSGVGGGTTGPHDFIPRLWATRKIGYLLEAIRLSGESRELKDEVIRLSQQYGILTPYTSSLILEDGDRPELFGVNSTARRMLYRAFVAKSPAGTSDQSESRGAKRDVELAGLRLGATSGKDAVAGGRAVGLLKKGDSKTQDYFLRVINSIQKRVQQVGARAFYLDGDRWVEGSLEEKDLSGARTLSYLSEEYFDLLSGNPGIGELLAVGPRVTFRWKTETIAIQ